jgi:hypothetical protein
VNEQPTPAAQPGNSAGPTPQEQIDQALLGALAAGRARHQDFDLMLPIMDPVVRVLFPAGMPPDWSLVSADDFVESLYVIARYASFTEDTRKIAFAQALQPAAGVM